jgi:hypothetical protein
MKCCIGYRKRTSYSTLILTGQAPNVTAADLEVVDELSAPGA